MFNAVVFEGILFGYLDNGSKMDDQHDFRHKRTVPFMIVMCQATVYNGYSLFYPGYRLTGS